MTKNNNDENKNDIDNDNDNNNNHGITEFMTSRFHKTENEVEIKYNIKKRIWSL